MELGAHTLGLGCLDSHLTQICHFLIRGLGPLHSVSLCLKVIVSEAEMNNRAPSLTGPWGGPMELTQAEHLEACLARASCS